MIGSKILFLTWVNIVLFLSGSLALTINQVHIKGKYPWTEKKLLQALNLNAGRPMDAQYLEQKQKEVLTYCQRQGYLKASIDSLTFLKDQKGLIIWLHVGPLFRIKQIQIVSDSIPPAQYLAVLQSRAGQPFDQNILNNDLKALLQWAAQKGFPFARVQVSRLQTEENDNQALVQIEIRIKEGRPVFIKDVVFNGLHYTKPRVVLRQLYFTPGMRFNQAWFSKMTSRIQKMQLFDQVAPPKLLRIAPDSVLIIQTVKEGNATSFDGVLGYVPPAANGQRAKGYLTGLIDLSFRNLFGSGRKFKLYWEKSDRLSENFHIRYLEPWIFNFPIDVGGAFSREVRDTLYIAYDFALNSQFHFNESFALFLNFSRQSVNPDSLASWQLGMVKTRTYAVQAGVQYDVRDYIPNPRRGLFYQSSYSYGLKQNLGPAAILLRDSLRKNAGLNSLHLQFEWYRSLFKNQVLAAKFYLKNIRGRHLQLSDYFWFGGSQSVRGYRERQFHGFLISWLNLEYRFIMGRNSRVFLFADFGYYRTKIQETIKEQMLRGLGFGLRFATPMGIMGIDYGLARGDSFGQGKIHVRLTSQF